MTKYKKSNYNYFIDYKDKKLLFNGLTGASFCMTTVEYEALVPLMDNPEKFKSDYPSDLNRLHKLGYLIEQDFDEIAYMKYKNRQAVFQNKDYHLTINPTLECNFRCWYCYEEHPKGYMSKATISRIKRHIKYMIEEEKITSLLLDWFGGEPLLYFYEVMCPLAIYAQKLCAQHRIPYSSQITTNAYCINEKMIAQFKKIQANTFQITLDGDRDRHDKIRNASGDPSYDIIIKNINLLCQNLENVKITLRINYDKKTLLSENIYSILDDVDETNRNKVYINMQRIWQTYDKKIQEQKNQELVDFIKIAKGKKFKTISSGGGISIGVHYTCYVSQYYHTEINYDGKIYKCTARDYKDQYVLGKLMKNGVIEWNEKKLSLMYANPLFENPTCLACRYLPICNGVCPQIFVETNGQITQVHCRLNNMEYSFENQIIDYYELIHQQ
jgi:uncharacterized protein